MFLIFLAAKFVVYHPALIYISVTSVNVCRQQNFLPLENIPQIFLLLFPSCSVQLRHFMCDECYLKMTIHSTRITLVLRNQFPSVRRKFLCSERETRGVFRGLSRLSSRPRLSISRASFWLSFAARRPRAIVV